MGRRRRVRIALACALGLATILWLPRAAAIAEPDAARGAYLAAAAGCDTCHTDAERGGRPYAGGRPLKTRFGTILTPNITPDLQTGIGGWSRADFERAMRWGIAPDDSHYVSSFPFHYYGRLTETDLADLKAFLDTVPAVVAAPQDGADSLALIARARDAVAVLEERFAGAWRPDAGKDQRWNRGAYLVATVGRCGECHTPRTTLGAPDPERFLAGVRAVPGGGGKIPNITPDRDTGIGSWSADDIAALLATGATPDGDFVGGAMARIVKNTARLTAADREAIAGYLLSLPGKPLGKKS